MVLIDINVYSRDHNVSQLISLYDFAKKWAIAANLFCFVVPVSIEHVLYTSPRRRSDLLILLACSYTDPTSGFDRLPQVELKRVELIMQNY